MRSTAFQNPVGHACGHTHWHEFRVHGSELVRRKANLCLALCPACHAHQMELISQCKGQSMQKVLHLPELKGRHGDIAEAQQLREGFIRDYGAILERDASGDPVLCAMQRAVTLQLMQSYASAWLARRPPTKELPMGISADVANLIRGGSAYSIMPGGIVEYLLKSRIEKIRSYVKKLCFDPALIESNLLPRLVT